MKVNQTNINLTTKFFVLILLITAISCVNNPKNEITREYIYNSEWGENNLANPVIEKISVKDDIYKKGIDKINGFDIFNNLIPKDSFKYFLEYHNNKDLNKVYFLKNNNIKWTSKTDYSLKKDSLGILELDTWYVFGNIRNTWIYYVYVDKEGEVFTWALNPVNI
jgi:hypothetical protein